MKATPTAIPDVLVIEPKVFGDARGFFFESFNQKAFNAAIGQAVTFVQDNHSRSSRGVLRGLHYQVQQPQGKLVRVVRGAVFDVVVDIRQGSTTYGEWVGVELSEDKHQQLWVPAGLAHGFLVLSDSVDFLYKPQTTMRLSLSVASPGTTRRWPLTGRSRVCSPSYPPKTVWVSVWLRSQANPAAAHTSKVTASDKMVG